MVMYKMRSCCIFFGLLVFLCSCSCPPGYVNCPNGSCSIFPKLCEVCMVAEQLVCPDGKTCVKSYYDCPLFDFLNYTLPVDERVNDLMRRLSMKEVLPQLMSTAPAIEHLGIPAYQWRNNAIHGLCQDNVTVFPQPIGMAASFNASLLRAVGHATADEGRAKYNMYTRENFRTQSDTGLDYYTPVINIARAPQWGRIMETFGEDPLLSGILAEEEVRGLQNENEYLQTIACCKHFAAYSLEKDPSNPSITRHNFDANVSSYDLQDTYFPAFEYCVRRGKARCIMCSYNSVDGVPSCADPVLLSDTLRKKWGFDGFVVSDNGAISDIYEQHQYVSTAEKAAAKAVIAGCDQDLGFDNVYLLYLSKAIESGMISEEVVRNAASRLFAIRMKLGLFDPPDKVPYNFLTTKVIDSLKHRNIALKAALQSIVLLKNDNNTLPFHWYSSRKSDMKTLAVVGPSANSLSVLWGTYTGTPIVQQTIFQALEERMTKCGGRCLYSTGCDDNHCTSTDHFSAAEDIVRQADGSIVVLGLDVSLESEGLDRKSIELPGHQLELVDALARAKKKDSPLVVVLMNGGPVDLSSLKNDDRVSVIIEAFYGGEYGGKALDMVLFGEYSPAGRLPLTYYKSTEDLAPFTSMSVSEPPGRTYRYFDGSVVYPFGYGLSFAQFRYSDLEISSSKISPCEGFSVSFDVENIPGVSSVSWNSDEVVQLYVSMRNVSDTNVKTLPKHSLAAFDRVHVLSGQSKHVELTVDAFSTSVVRENGERIVSSCEITVYVGGGQPGVEGTDEVLKGRVLIVGSTVVYDECVK